MENQGLLIAALVAIVAIVGLVILFAGENTGAISVCPEGYRLAATGGSPGQGAFLCVPNEAVPRHNRFPTHEEQRNRRQEILIGGY